MPDEITSPPSSTPMSVESPYPKPVTILNAFSAAKSFIKGPEGENDHPLSPTSVNPVVSEFQAAASPIVTPEVTGNTTINPPESPWNTPAPTVEPTITTITNTSPGSQEAFGQSNDTNLPVSPAAGFTAPIAPSMEQTAIALNELASTPAFKAQSEAIRAGIDQGPPVVVNMADAETHDAPKTPEEAQIQKEGAWSNVMDQMEEDVENNGWYFAKFGKVEFNNKDARFLVLRYPVSLGQGVEKYLAVTRDGTYLIGPQEQNFARIQTKVDDRIKAYEDNFERVEQLGAGLYQEGHISFDQEGGLSGKVNADINSPISIEVSNDSELFRETVSKSRKLTKEIDDKRTAEIRQTQDSIRTANEISEFLKSPPQPSS